MEHTLQSWLLTARTRRRLSQRELSNIAQVNIASVGVVERGDHSNWSPRIAAAIGLALHEVAPFTPEEITTFCALTGVEMSIFADRPGMSEREAAHRQIKPIIDRLLDQFDLMSVIAFIKNAEALVRTLRTGALEPKRETVLTHVSAPKYRPDLNATEQVFTDYAKAPKPRATPLKKKSGGA